MKPSLKEIGMFIQKHSNIIIACLILIITFSISRLPYFLYYGIVGYHPDTPVYFMALEGIYKGELPKFGSVPPLYPLFLYFLGLISENNLVYVYVQSLITLSAALLLIYTFYKNLPKFTIPISIGMSLFLISSHSIIFDTSLLTESIYVSSLITLFALFIAVSNSDKTSNWILFSSLLSFPLLLRPNGIVVFILILITILHITLVRKSKKLLILLLGPFTLICAITMLYTYITLGSIFPDRLMNYIKTDKVSVYKYAKESYQGDEVPYSYEEFEKIKKIEERESKRTYKKRSFIVNNIIFLNSISYESIPFYTKETYYRYELFYEKNYIDKVHNTNSLIIAPMSTSFKSRLYKNYYPDLPEINFGYCCDVKNTNSQISKSLLYKSYNIVYKKIFLVFFRNKFLVVLIFISLALSIVNIYLSRGTDKISMYSLYLNTLLFFSSMITSVSGHNPGGMRYTYSTDFIYYIAPLFIPYMLNYIALKKNILFNNKLTDDK